jgi:hypothetical protein
MPRDLFFLTCVLPRLSHLNAVVADSNLFSSEASRRSALHCQWDVVFGESRADRWRGLRRQAEFEMVEQQSKVLFRLGVARRYQTAAVGGGQQYVKHLDRARLFQHGVRREIRRIFSDAIFQRHGQPVGGSS